ncbi:TPA: hypothetical protein ACXYLJ_002943 [Legionella pneumophila]
MKKELSKGFFNPLTEIGFMIALGTNFGLYGISWRLLWSFLSWLDVGYLLVQLTAVR